MTNYRNKSIYFLLGAVVIIAAGVALMRTGGGVKKQTETEQPGGFIGKSLPDIELADKDGKAFSLDSLKGKNVVLFFNEGLMCYPACWDQIAAFANDQRFGEADRVAISVVADSPQDWQKAVEKMPELGKAKMLFDKNGAASQRLGLLTMSSSMHIGQLAGHTYVLLDKQGTVKEIFDDTNMAINNERIIEMMTKYQ